MKVKIGDNIYDPEQEPIMVIFDSEEEKKLIGNMPIGRFCYCACPSDPEWIANNNKKIDEWMSNVHEEIRNIHNMKEHLNVKMRYGKKEKP